MTTTEPAGYDTISGIREHLSDGLDGLRRLVRARMDAGYKRRERLGEFIIAWGRFWLDSCGNAMACEVTVPGEKDVSLAGSLPLALCLDVLRDTIPNVSIAGRMAQLPPSDAACPECGDGWTMSTCHDVTAWRDDGDARSYRHRLCAELSRERERAAWYRDVCRDAGLGDMVLVPVPSEYSKGDPSWCRIRTPKGDMVIGWRKRVVNFEWMGLVEYETARDAKTGDYSTDHDVSERIRAKFDGDKLFAAEDVTKGPTHVHAWTREKLIEYLRKLSEAARIGTFKPVAGT